jgi:two-component system chemotaxis response regulator CheY
MKKRLLVAEDERDLLTIYRLILGDTYELYEAQNGQEAIELWKRHNPDLILMDIQMPIKSGDIAIREILREDPHAKILAVTAYRHTCEELGVPVLAKGFEPSEFLSAVERLLHNDSV